MSLPHFFLNDQVLANEAQAEFPLALSRDDAKHAKVLRLAPGEHVAVVDAAQDYFECEIVSFAEALPVVRIAGHLDQASDMPHVCLVQGLAKGDKMETVIRHATELGVAEFIPFAAARSIMKVDAKKAAAKTERWQAIAKSAAMQSGQTRLAHVNQPMKLAPRCAPRWRAFDAVLVCWEEAPGTARAARSASERASSVQEHPISKHESQWWLAPRADLLQEEVDALWRCNAHASLVSLGPLHPAHGNRRHRGACAGAL